LVTTRPSWIVPTGSSLLSTWKSALSFGSLTPIGSWFASSVPSSAVTCSRTSSSPSARSRFVFQKKESSTPSLVVSMPAGKTPAAVASCQASGASLAWRHSTVIATTSEELSLTADAHLDVARRFGGVRRVGGHRIDAQHLGRIVADPELEAAAVDQRAVGMAHEEVDVGDVDRAQLGLEVPGDVARAGRQLDLVTADVGAGERHHRLLAAAVVREEELGGHALAGLEVQVRGRDLGFSTWKAVSVGGALPPLPPALLRMAAVPAPQLARSSEAERMLTWRRPGVGCFVAMRVVAFRYTALSLIARPSGSKRSRCFWPKRSASPSPSRSTISMNMYPASGAARAMGGPKRPGDT
jgi:hypothetical protein